MGIEVLDRADQDLRPESKIILIGPFPMELLTKMYISNRPGDPWTLNVWAGP